MNWPATHFRLHTLALALILAAVTLALVLATGCGDQTTAHDPPDEETTSQTPAFQDTSGPVPNQERSLLQEELSVLPQTTSKYQFNPYSD